MKNVKITNSKFTGIREMLNRDEMRKIRGGSVNNCGQYCGFDPANAICRELGNICVNCDWEFTGTCR